MLYLEYMNINVRLIGQAPEGKMRCQIVLRKDTKKN
jgi:hypothetical protein